jgi:hypothetical protein
MWNEPRIQKYTSLVTIHRISTIIYTMMRTLGIPVIRRGYMRCLVDLGMIRIMMVVEEGDWKVALEVVTEVSLLKIVVIWEQTSEEV